MYSELESPLIAQYWMPIGQPQQDEWKVRFPIFLHTNDSVSTDTMSDGIWIFLSWHSSAPGR
jgi:hypothetical protein